MVDVNKEKIFVYSDMQISEAKQVNIKINRTFTCGNVSVGPTSKRYSKIINVEDLKPMCAQYPDTVIVCRGRLSDFKYTPIKEDFIVG